MKLLVIFAHLNRSKQEASLPLSQGLLKHMRNYHVFVVLPPTAVRIYPSNEPSCFAHHFIVLVSRDYMFLESRNRAVFCLYTKRMSKRAK